MQERFRVIDADEFISPKPDFPKTIKRQLSNDILMFRTASSVLHLLPLAGLYTFLPKYLESQFRLPAHDANLISGLGGILVMGVGIVISGVVILKFSPTARSVAAWIAFTAMVYSAGKCRRRHRNCWWCRCYHHKCDRRHHWRRSSNVLRWTVQ